MIEYRVGDIRDTDCKVIAHGVNCQGVMGSGVAKALYEKYPEVKKQYIQFFKECPFNPDAILGARQLVECCDKIIFNCFTQQNYGYDKQVYLNYQALKSVLERVYYYCDDKKINEIAIPKIGCGLAGGDWDQVEEIINEVFPEDFKVIVYELKGDK